MYRVDPSLHVIDIGLIMVAVGCPALQAAPMRHRRSPPLWYLRRCEYAVHGHIARLHSTHRRPHSPHAYPTSLLMVMAPLRLPVVRTPRVFMVPTTTVLAQSILATSAMRRSSVYRPLGDPTRRPRTPSHYQWSWHLLDYPCPPLHEFSWSPLRRFSRNRCPTHPP